MLHRGLIMTQPVIDGGYIDCIYNVTTTTSPTKLLGFNNGQMSMIRSMEIDGVSIQPVSEYIFNTAKQYRIRFYINYVFSALNMFKDCTALVSIVFNTNTDINLNLSNIANGCRSLQNVQFKDDMNIKSLEQSFYRCTSLDTVDLTNVEYKNLSYTFYGASVKNIIFGDVDSVNLRGTFFVLKNKETTIDLTKIKKISGYSQPFASAEQPKLIDFGECDLSSCTITKDCFFDFNSKNSSAKTIMLGKPMQYPNTISVQDKMYGEFIYNLDYDFSPIFYEHPNLIPIANKPIPKTLQIRFCTDNNWITDTSYEFVINNTVGEYDSKGIWKFTITADTYKYPILYNGVEIGEAIVKDDDFVQQIAFGNNNEVYKVLDFSSKNLIDTNIITDIEGEWGWPEDMQSLKDQTGDSSYWENLDTQYFNKGYLGYTHKRVDINKTTSVTINTDMQGEVIITTAQNSQTYYYYGTLYYNDNKQHTMNGDLYQAAETKFKVNTVDGILKFTYSKIYTKEDPPATNGLDRMFIKKIEHYNWPDIPE